MLGLVRAPSGDLRRDQVACLSSHRELPEIRGSESLGGASLIESHPLTEVRCVIRVEPMSKKPSIKGSPTKPSRKTGSPPPIAPVPGQAEIPSRPPPLTVPFGLKIAAGLTLLTLALIGWVGIFSNAEKAKVRTEASRTDDLLQEDGSRAQGIATSISIYATDYDQIFPPFEMWEQRLEPYIKEPSTLATVNPDAPGEPFVFPAEYSARSTELFESTQLPLIYGQSPWNLDGEHTLATIGLEKKRVSSTVLESLLRNLRSEIQVRASGESEGSRMKQIEELASKMTYMTLSDKDFQELPPQDARFVRNCFWALQRRTFEEEKLLGFTKDYPWELPPNGSEAALPVFQQENIRRLKAHAQKANK